MEEQFQRLVQYLDRRFDGIGGEFDSLRGEFKDLQRRFDDLQVAVETYTQRADAFFQEMVMLSHRSPMHRGDDSEGCDGAAWQGGRVKCPEA